MDYLLQLLILVLLYAALAVSLDLIAGHMGLVSLGHAAFFGIGAYTAALLAVRAQMPFPVDLLLAAVLGALASLGVSLPSLRLRGDYFVIATFAFQMIVFSTMNNWVALTGGPRGLAGVPPLTLGSMVLTGRVYYVFIAAALVVVAVVVNYRWTTGPVGRVLHAIREDEVFALAAGKPTIRFKVATSAMAASIAAAAGAIYARYMTFIDPTSFTVSESILVLSMVLIGGAGGLLGPLLGAFVLVTLPEVLRFVGLPSSVAANLRQMIYGIALVMIVAFRPHGLLGRYAFGKA